MTHSAPTLRACLLVLGVGCLPASAQTTFTAVGPDAAAIQPTVDSFRNALGGLNPFTPENFAGGRRQIDWDAAPDAVSAPNAFPGDFFNFGASPRARGIEFSTPGSGFQLSATQASGAGIEFDNLNPTYSSLFETFSAERLFTPIGSNLTEVTFFDPVDQTTPATTRGFGAVFSDVDFINISGLEFFDASGASLLEVFAPSNPLGVDNEALSFAGALFDEPVIASVLITTGNVPVGPDENLMFSTDIVVLDDFLFGEPVPVVPEPVSAGLACSACLGLLARSSRRGTRA